MGTIRARIGYARSQYRITPGLYAVGRPGPDAPFLVTANYKLSFDAVRYSLKCVNAWILVLDTRGVNVWCAAGKGTFSTEELIFSVEQTRIKGITAHPTLILPQLAAPGVSLLKVEKECGVKALFGPIQAKDLTAFLQQKNTATEAMRSITFTMRERAVLTPVEFYLLLRPLGIIALLAFLISGVGPAGFSFQESGSRGLSIIFATVLGSISGSLLTPILLPWLHGRQFWIKGIWPALALGFLFSLNMAEALAPGEHAALLLWILAVSSYQGMMFTGSTPFTSLSGVEYEMRRGIPVQLLLTVLSLLLWMSAPFLP